jgi:hypothetical protein
MNIGIFTARKPLCRKMLTSVKNILGKNKLSAPGIELAADARESDFHPLHCDNFLQRSAPVT